MIHLQIERYLLGEMTEEEREKLEEKILADDEVFFEVCETENSLVDRFVADSLNRADAVRFEKALDRNPALAEKVANARALKTHIASEREATEVAAASPTFWQKISGMFSFASPAPAFAMGGLVLLLAIGMGMLALENIRRNAEIARLEAELTNSSRSTAREAELEQALANSQTRESQLQQQIDSEKDISGDLTADLARERENRRKLEAEIEALRKESTTPIGRPTPAAIEPPTILAVTLRPGGARGGDAATINFAGAKRLSILLALPANVDQSERLSIRLNGQEIARDVLARTDSVGIRSLPVTLSPSQLKPGQNVITVHGPHGSVISEYSFVRKEGEER